MELKFKDPFRNPETNSGSYVTFLEAVLRIRIHGLHMFLGFLDPDPLVRGMDPDPALDPDPDPSVMEKSFIYGKIVRKTSIPTIL
jgi:hypothetical protein